MRTPASGRRRRTPAARARRTAGPRARRPWPQSQGSRTAPPAGSRRGCTRRAGTGRRTRGCPKGARRARRAASGRGGRQRLRRAGRRPPAPAPPRRRSHTTARAPTVRRERLLRGGSDAPRGPAAIVAPTVTGLGGYRGPMPAHGLPAFSWKSFAPRSTKPGFATTFAIASTPPAARSRLPCAPFQRQFALATLPMPTGPAHQASTLARTRELLMTLRVTTLSLEAYAAEYAPPADSLEKRMPSPFPSITLFV